MICCEKRCGYWRAGHRIGRVHRRCRRLHDHRSPPTASLRPYLRPAVGTWWTPPERWCPARVDWCTPPPRPNPPACSRRQRCYPAVPPTRRPRPRHGCGCWRDRYRDRRRLPRLPRRPAWRCWRCVHEANRTRRRQQLSRASPTANRTHRRGRQRWQTMRTPATILPRSRNRKMRRGRRTTTTTTTTISPEAVATRMPISANATAPDRRCHRAAIARRALPTWRPTCGARRSALTTPTALRADDEHRDRASAATSRPARTHTTPSVSEGRPQRPRCHRSNARNIAAQCATPVPIPHDRRSSPVSAARALSAPCICHRAVSICTSERAPPPCAADAAACPAAPCPSGVRGAQCHHR